MKYSSKIGQDIYTLCQKLWPITRSITGNGVRETLGIIKDYLPDLVINEIPTDTNCFDWKVPREWNINDAYVISPNGAKIINYKDNNLHVVSYSTPINKVLSLMELQEHLHSLPEQPSAIPYVTSYYHDRWGFCLSENQRNTLTDGDYQVCIDSELSNGSLTYAELIIKGRTDKEVFLSTYICHPSMANNELSGPTVTTYLAQWIQSRPREYTYRIIFIPETIGSICYLSKNSKAMKKNIIAGYNITCVGDNNAYSYLPSRQGATLSDRVALHVLSHIHPDFIKYSYLDRGSDERQYCSPGIDLPVASIMRTRYGSYKEYHTSLDNLDYISADGLYGAYDVLAKCITCIEDNKIYKTTILCEPNMGKRNLYPTLRPSKYQDVDIKIMMDTLAYIDGESDLLSIAEILDVSLMDIQKIIKLLLKESLIEESH